jgi:hypothetical protein
LREASQRLTSLEELVLCFNNPAQQFETRQLVVLASLPTLKALTVQVRVLSGMRAWPSTAAHAVVWQLQHCNSNNAPPPTN